MDINPEQFAGDNSAKETSVFSKREDFGKDDDDPLSIKDSSLTFLGFILSFLTVFLPSISVLLERPLPHNNEVNLNQMLNKDGS